MAVPCCESQKLAVHVCPISNSAANDHKNFRVQSTSSIHTLELEAAMVVVNLGGMSHGWIGGGGGGGGGESWGLQDPPPPPPHSTAIYKCRSIWISFRLEGLRSVKMANSFLGGGGREGGVRGSRNFGGSSASFKLSTTKDSRKL